MIYVTGDTHGGSDVRKLLNPKNTSMLKKGDTLIICGDFGFVWNYKKEDRKEAQWLDWFNDRPYTTVFADGNHECFPRLNAYPEEERFGGRVNVIRPNLYHLKRGEIYTIEGNTIFALGGARSHDRGPHIDHNTGIIGKYWWEEELPSQAEYDHATENLKKADNQVDYIITHCLPSTLQDIVTEGKFPFDPLTEYLEALRMKVKYKHWYTGHYHIDRDLSDNISVVFAKIIELGKPVRSSVSVPGSPVYKKQDKVTFMLDGNACHGTIRNVYPWGTLRDHTTPYYDIVLDEPETGKTVQIKEGDIVSLSEPAEIREDK